MIPTIVDTYLSTLFTLAHRKGYRVLLHRQDARANDDDVFILELVDEDGAPVIDVTTKNIESAAAWIIDQRRRDARR